MMRSFLIATAAAVVAAFATVAVETTAAAGGKPEPKPTAVFAKTWEAAVAEAKDLNVPIVVHSHGFY
ncbi:MAG: hypothetical protein K8T90_05085 [Planctomycetes bacterium]|nr:hypothetical protein [Planctomycetota bacterium]